MKIAKFFAGIFGAVGTLLLVGSIGLCLFSLNAPTRVTELPAKAVECSELFSDAVARKDYDVLEGCIYGQPELGLSGKPEDELVRMVWDLIEGNLSLSWQGDSYFQDGTLCRRATVRYMDAASITANLQTRAHALLTQKVEEATDMAQLYDESGEFRQDLVDQVMKAALTQACMEDVKTVTEEVTVQLINRDGQWWVVPDAVLMRALSGGLE